MTMLVMGAAGLAVALWLVAIALEKPRLLTYSIFAIAPTQFLFIPVSSFFVSPADVLVAAAAAALAVRLAAGDPHAFGALWRHRYLLLMVVSYVIGFMVLQTFSRTLIRVLLAILPSILASEVFRTRRHIWRAATALVIAAIIDAGYGIAMYAIGIQLHPTRFSGMSNVNFSAMVILTGAAIAFAQRAGTARWLHLARPGALAVAGLATLSQMGLLAFVSTSLVVLRRVMAPRNARRIVTVAVIGLVVGFSYGPVRERISRRGQTDVMQHDGVARRSAEIRWMILGVAWTAFKESPLVGVGYSNFQRYSLVNPEIAASTANQGYFTHNTYLEILAEGGLLAFLCLCLHARQYLSRIGPALRDLRRRRDYLAASALVGLPIVVIVAGLANVLVHYHFWAIAGLGLSYLQVRAAECRAAAAVLVETRSLVTGRVASAP